MHGVVAALLLTGTPATPPAPPPAPGTACLQAALAAERRWQLPADVLAAIGHVESGRRDPVSGRVQPWPWAIDVGGVDQVFATEAQAEAAVMAWRAAGVQSIDIGCFQVNLHYHPEAFASLADGFRPEANADYAGRLLRSLFARSGSWETAIADYHSAEPDRGGPYRVRVLAAWHAMQTPLPAPADSHVLLVGSIVPRMPIYTLATLPAAWRVRLGLDHRERDVSSNQNSLN